MPSVVEVIPIPPDSGGIDADSGGAYTLKYRVQMDGVYADHTAVIAATDGTTAIPDFGTTHPVDTTTVVVSKQATPDDESPDWWTVTVAYKVPTTNPSPPESPDPPTTASGGGGTISPIPNQKQSIKWLRKPKAFETDIAGDDVKNSAGDPYDPPPQDEALYAEFTVIRTQADFDTRWMDDYRNARNHAAFEFAGKTWDEHTLRITDISAEWPAGSSGNGWQVTIVILADTTGDEHDIALLDAGFRYLDGATRKRFVDAETGTPSTQPRRLDGAGAALAAASPNVFNYFRTGPYVDFKNLRLSWHGAAS